MFRIPRRYNHFIFGVMQSGLTCLIASAIASLPLTSMSEFFRHWLISWVVSWAAMMPVVLLAAPAIRALSLAMTHDDRARAE